MAKRKCLRNAMPFRRVALALCLLLGVYSLVIVFSNHDVSRSTIDNDQIQLLDWLNGERTGDSLSEVFGGSLVDPSGFNPISASLRTVSHAASFKTSSVFREHLTRNAFGDFGDLGRKMRALYLFHRLLLLKQISLDQIQSRTLETAMQILTSSLIPWLSPHFSNLTELYMSFVNGEYETGIVITGGSKHFYLIQHLILTLRQEFNITLPIQIFYIGPGDMNPAMIHFFDKMPGVETVDLTTVFVEETIKASGWSCKPFAILASKFRRVLFMDADVLFFKNPVTVTLNSSVFLKHGLLFYRDRKVHQAGYDKGVYLLSKAVPKFSLYAKSLGYVKALGNPSLESHAMDSGFVVIDKSNFGAFYCILFAAVMNSANVRNILYGVTYGDKESFWFSAEILRIPYEFNRAYGSALGKLRVDPENPRFPQVCGISLLQVDKNNDLFLWNGGGLLEDRYAAVGEFKFADLTHVAVDLDGEGSEWSEGHCSNFTGRPGNGVRELSDTEKAVLKRYRDIYTNQVRDP